MKTILLPTDFSDNSKKAIDYALQLFKNELCTFYVLHVQKASNYTTDDLMTTPSGSTIYKAVLFNAKKELKEYVNLIRAKHKNTSHIFKERIDYDSLTGAINQITESQKIDLIIMGSNGASNVSEAVFGSNTLRVIRAIQCPTIVVPKNYVFKTPQKVLFILDPKNEFHAKLLEPFLDMCIKFTSEIHFLKTTIDKELSPKTLRNQEKMVAYFKNIKREMHEITNVPITDAINTCVQLIKTDLVGLVLKKESFLERLFSGSITDNINYSSQVPIFFMHEDDSE